MPCTEGIFVHSKEASVISCGSNISNFRSAAWVTPEEILPKPFDEWRAEEYLVEPCSKVKAVEENHIFQLGGSQIQVLHLPGHSPGSIGLFRQQDGVLVTGDTVYSTDEELIDWYPESSTMQMTESVQRIADLAGQVQWALPGHNDVLDQAQLIAACEYHLKSNKNWMRPLQKGLVSRPRTNLVLSANASTYRHFLPQIFFVKAREWIKR